MATADLLGLLEPRRRSALRWLVAAAVLSAGLVAGWVLSGGQSQLEHYRHSLIEESVAVPQSVPTLLRTRRLQQWLADISSDAGLGLVIAPELADREATALFSVGESWRQRLESLSRVEALAWELRDGVLEVRSQPPADPQPDTIIVETETHTQQQASRADAAAAPAAAPMVTRIVRLANARAADLAAVISTTAGAAGVSVVAETAVNALLIRGVRADVEEAQRLASELDIPRRRFLLETRIVEVSHSLRRELGVEWSVQGNLGALVDLPAASSEGEGAAVTLATAGAHALEARLSALEADGRVRIVSRPRVLVVEGTTALIESVRVLRIRLPSRTAVVAGAEGNIETGDGRAVQEIPVGISLRVEPTLQGGGKIGLRIRAKSSTLGPPLPPDDIPEEISRLVEASVVVADGETAVLGGLRREARRRSGTGIPLLRALPLVGALFGRRANDRDGEELMVLVTPHLLR